jgi:hypothetical protein
MRLVVTLCAVALVACSADSREPIVTGPPTSHLSPPALHADSATPIALGPGPRSIPDRIADVVGTGLAKVSLPPDDYSLSSDAVHPDVACQNAGWNGARCWLMYTPYKNSDPSYENPAILIAANDTTWRTPPGVLNPIVPYPGLRSFNSDPDHAFEPGSNRLVQVYRVVSDSFNNIMIMSTANSATSTRPRVAFRERNHDAISPSLILAPDRSARLWYVRAGIEGCNSSTSSVALRSATPTANQRVDEADWSTPVDVHLSIPGWVVWHLDVEQLPEGRGYVALIVAFPRQLDCASSDLWLATSADGIDWRTYAMPMLWRGMTLARNRRISTWYRGTLRYDAANDSLHIWPSALAGPNWTVYHTAVKLDDLLSLLSAAKPSDLAAINKTQTGIRAVLSMP